MTFSENSKKSWLWRETLCYGVFFNNFQTEMVALVTLRLAIYWLTLNSKINNCHKKNKITKIVLKLLPIFCYPTAENRKTCHKKIC